MKAGGVLLLDEIDLGGHLMMCLQPVLEGKGVYVKKINEWVHPAAGFTILATANTKGQGDDTGKFSGTGMMNEAMLDRFHFTMEQPYASASTERKILTKNMKKWGMDVAKGTDNYEFADLLTKWAETIRKTFLDGGCTEIITTRRLERVVEAFAIFGDRMKAVKMSSPASTRRRRATSCACTRSRCQGCGGRRCRPPLVPSMWRTTQVPIDHWMHTGSPRTPDRPAL